jgi:protein TonB
MKCKITFSILVILTLVNGLQAEPPKICGSSEPEPVGGFAALQKNTEYPSFAKRERFKGEVVLNFAVSKNGEVSDIVVVKSAGDLFDQSAITAVLRTEWLPARQGENPIAVVYELPFEFRIKKF